jgi:UDP-N-acetylglucosamine 2-epimerase
MKRITLIVGTRPEAIKMAPVYLELKQRLGESVQLVSTGQHRELLWQSSEEFRNRTYH